MPTIEKDCNDEINGCKVNACVKENQKDEVEGVCVCQIEIRSV